MRNKMNCRRHFRCCRTTAAATAAANDKPNEELMMKGEEESKKELRSIFGEAREAVPWKIRKIAA